MEDINSNSEINEDFEDYSQIQWISPKKMLNRTIKKLYKKEIISTPQKNVALEKLEKLKINKTVMDEELLKEVSLHAYNTNIVSYSTLYDELEQQLEEQEYDNLNNFNNEPNTYFSNLDQEFQQSILSLSPAYLEYLNPINYKSICNEKGTIPRFKASTLTQLLYGRKLTIPEPFQSCYRYMKFDDYGFFEADRHNLFCHRKWKRPYAYGEVYNTRGSFKPEFWDELDSSLHIDSEIEDMKSYYKEPSFGSTVISENNGILLPGPLDGERVSIRRYDESVSSVTSMIERVLYRLKNKNMLKSLRTVSVQSANVGQNWMMEIISDNNVENYKTKLNSRDQYIQVPERVRLTLKNNIKYTNPIYRAPSTDACVNHLKRLRSDLRAIIKHPPEGCVATPVGHTLTEWVAVIFGPDDTEWESGTFVVSLSFPAQYPTQPPKVRFLSRIFHPNVYADGNICLDILQDRWSPVYSVSSVLQSLRTLLSDPNPMSPADVTSAEMFVSDKGRYEEQVKQFCRLSWQSAAYFLRNDTWAFGGPLESEQQAPTVLSANEVLTNRSTTSVKNEILPNNIGIIDLERVKIDNQYATEVISRILKVT